VDNVILIRVGLHSFIKCSSFEAGGYNHCDFTLGVMGITVVNWEAFDIVSDHI
jgi:hypothetical protein